MLSSVALRGKEIFPPVFRLLAGSPLQGTAKPPGVRQKHDHRAVVWPGPSQKSLVELDSGEMIFTRNKLCDRPDEFSASSEIVSVSSYEPISSWSSWPRLFSAATWPAPACAWVWRRWVCVASV